MHKISLNTIADQVIIKGTTQKLQLEWKTLWNTHNLHFGILTKLKIKKEIKHPTVEDTFKYN